MDASFIDISNKSRLLPLGFMGRFEAHYDRLGAYLDGNYMDLALKPTFGSISKGIDSQLGVLDYGLAYRVLGPSAAEVPATLAKKGNPNWLEAYAGARTIWLDNSVDFKTPFGNPLNGPRSFSASKSFTSPVLGARFAVGFSPEGFVLADGAFGGFGKVVNWGAEQPRGSYPLAPVANMAETAQGFMSAAPFVLDVELEIDGRRWIGARMIGL